RETGVNPFHWGGLRDVESLALRNPLRDIEKNDVAQLLQASQQGQCAADVACADQRDLVACHECSPGLLHGNSVGCLRPLSERYKEWSLAGSRRPRFSACASGSRIRPQPAFD